jgi:parallel beta-helix repeat protein
MRKYIAILICVLFPVLASAVTRYVATPQDGGSDLKSGSQASPYATLQKAHDVSVAGDTILMRGGVYTFGTTTFTRDGTSGNTIKVFNFPGESPVIDASNQRAIPAQGGVLTFNGASFWHIKGLEIKNGSINGIGTRNSGNNTFELNKIHDNGRLANGGGTGTGLKIIGPSSGNLTLNNDIYNNDDKLGSGGGGNGTDQPESRSGTSGNVIRGNRVWRNSDDGIDLYNSKGFLIEGNWSWENGYAADGVTARGNGMGFKLGGPVAGDGGHTIRNNVAFRNRFDGFAENGADNAVLMYNNTTFNNVRLCFSFFNNNGTSFRNNVCIGNVGRVVGTPPFNSWTLPVTANTADFTSTAVSCALSPRQGDGSLPSACGFARLVSGSDLIDKGTNVGIAFNGSAPDLGAYEFGATGGDTTPPTVSVTAPANGATVVGP